jgi:predicted secreted protein
MMMASNLTIWRTVLFAVLPIIVISILSVTIAIAYGQTSGAPQNYVIRRVEIWGLFYRGMVAAFIVGALVQGCTVYIAWRFRESNKKTHPPREPPEDSLR